MNKLEYITRSLSQSRNKKYEHYVINRIWNKLDDINLEFITQQHISCQERRYLTDIYFPQLKLHVEVKEPFHSRFEIQDISRENNIIGATEHKIEEVIITDNTDIEELNQSIDTIIRKIRSEKNKLIEDGYIFEWDYENRLTTEYHLQNGYVSVEENSTFRTIKDACNCYGHQYKGFQKAWTKNLSNKDQYLWFPKFYENKEWDNSISEDGLYITERCKNPELAAKNYDKNLDESVTRVTFPRIKDNLGLIAYRFAGIFKVDKDKSSKENGIMFKRISKKSIFLNSGAL